MMVKGYQRETGADRLAQVVDLVKEAGGVREADRRSVEGSTLPNSVGHGSDRGRLSDQPLWRGRQTSRGWLSASLNRQNEDLVN